MGVASPARLITGCPLHVGVECNIADLKAGLGMSRTDYWSRLTAVHAIEWCKLQLLQIALELPRLAAHQPLVCCERKTEGGERRGC